MKGKHGKTAVLSRKEKQTKNGKERRKKHKLPKCSLSSNGRDLGTVESEILQDRLPRVSERDGGEGHGAGDMGLDTFLNEGRKSTKD